MHCGGLKDGPCVSDSLRKALQLSANRFAMATSSLM
jgi:hypothetical protein